MTLQAEVTRSDERGDGEGMKVMTIVGTRPEIIRLSLIIDRLDRYADRHILVHTGQNYTDSLSGVFFREMGIRPPDHILSNRQRSLGGQLAVIFEKLEPLLQREQPDRVLVLGDTNSALSAILAERMGIPVVHMEAGNRCFDGQVPEEKNRRVIDAVSSINMPYTPQSKANLLREGVPVDRIVLTGNPIYEVLQTYESQIDQSHILDRLKLRRGEYMLATIHRAENVDRPDTLASIFQGLNMVADTYGMRMITSVHPRTRSRLQQSGDTELHPLIELYEPFGFFDFVSLEKHAACVLTDSGTVQEECCLFHVPTVTVRTTTERPETVDCGSNIVAGVRADGITRAVSVQMASGRSWICPEGYMERSVSDKVVKYMSGSVPSR